MRKLLLLTCLLAGQLAMQAQNKFFAAVKVEFEKTTAVRALIKDMWADDPDDNGWYEQNKEHYPVSLNNYFIFSGDTARSLYEPGKEVPVDNRFWWRPLGDKNIVYTNFQQQKTIAQKPVFEETFLMEDSLLKIKWKITGDLRTIAGFECRKAVGLINDSITVFAFYTDEILVNGGPEGVHGLPGMILGMGIPRLHVTWFATKVEILDPGKLNIAPATRGKKVTRASMSGQLEKVLKDWGKYGGKLIINFLI